MDFLKFLPFKGDYWYTRNMHKNIYVIVFLQEHRTSLPGPFIEKQYRTRYCARHVRAYSADYLILYAIQDVQYNTEESPQGLERLVEFVILYSGLFNDRYAIEK